MSECETNEPMIAGAPGRTSCVSTMPASASAVCCASAAGIETGPIAPMRMNGVITFTWFASAKANSDSIMRVSKRSGELALMMPNSVGVASMAARPPCTISAMAIESSAAMGSNCAPP